MWLLNLEFIASLTWLSSGSIKEGLLSLFCYYEFIEEVVYVV